MQRQIRHFSKSIVCIVCSTLITFSASLAFGVGKKKADSPLASYGMTEQEFESEAKEFLGIPYRKGGTSTRGFDCSGFARMIYERLFGIELPHNSIDQFRSSDLEKIATRDLQPGDLIFFGKKRINHVGVYLSDGQFIHASSSQGVMVSSLEDRYWKKRFVGSKRHLALKAGGSGSQVRFESSVEIPLSRNGTLTGFTRNEFESEDNSLLQVDFNTFTDLPAETLAMDQPHLQLYEIGYDHALTEGLNMHFTAIHETFDSSMAIPGLDAYTQTASYRLDDGSSEVGVRQGVKLAGNFQPSDWLMITPSITYFDYSLEGESELFDTPTRTLGLNTVLTPEDSLWSLSMLLQYSDQDSKIGMSSSDNMLSSLNMGVKLGINLTDNLQFSIIGKHDKRTATYGVAEEATLIEKSNSDFFLSFDLSY